MSQGRGGRKAIRRMLLAGLVLVVSLLGHDLLMVGAAAAESPDAAILHGPVTAAHGEAHAATPREDAPPDHPESCGVGQAAVVRGGDEPRFAALCSATRPEAVGAVSPAANGGPSEWEEPRWPPDVRRALLQVYRV